MLPVKFNLDLSSARASLNSRIIYILLKLTTYQQYTSWVPRTRKFKVCTHKLTITCPMLRLADSYRVISISEANNSLAGSESSLESSLQHKLVFDEAVTGRDNVY